MNLVARLALTGFALAAGVVAQDAERSQHMEVAGVKLPKKIQVGDTTLALNGMGLRTKTIFAVKVYVAGLYLEKPSTDAAHVIASEEKKRVELTFLRDLDRSKITDAIEEGFERNSKADMRALRDRLEQLQRMIPDVKKGDRLQITYLPGEGTRIAVKDVDKGLIEGKDFAGALFSVWLGRDPVDEDLKDALLGR